MSDLKLIQDYLKNPQNLLDDIDNAMNNLPIEEVPLVTLSSEDTQDATEAKSIKGNTVYHRYFEQYLKKRKKQIHLACCVEGDYCKFKKKNAPTISVITSVVDSITAAAIVIPIPIATISCYCVQSLFLDKICSCDDK